MANTTDAANVVGTATLGIPVGDVANFVSKSLATLGKMLGIKGKAKSSGRATTESIIKSAFGTWFDSLYPYWSKDGGLLPDLNAYSDAVVRIDYWFAQWDHDVITQAVLESNISNLMQYMATKGVAAYNSDAATKTKLVTSTTGETVTIAENNKGGSLGLLFAAGAAALLLL